VLAGAVQKCGDCGNSDPSNFALDPQQADVICRACGLVVCERQINETSAHRNFEDEEDKNHHGPARRAYLSEGSQLGSNIAELPSKSAASQLKQSQDWIKMNCSQFGRDNRRTRDGYKDKMKQIAFQKIQHLAHSLNLHENVVEKAKEMFSGFRDVREHVHQFDTVLAACLIWSFREMGKSRTRRIQQLGSQRRRRPLTNTFALVGAHPPAPAAHVTAVQAEVAEVAVAVEFKCPQCLKAFGSKRELKYTHSCPKKGLKRQREEEAAAASAGPQEGGGFGVGGGGANVLPNRSTLRPWLAKAGGGRAAAMMKLSQKR
jgi:hypothetical protein